MKSIISGAFNLDAHICMEFVFMHEGMSWLLTEKVNTEELKSLSNRLTWVFLFYIFCLSSDGQSL